MGAVDYSQQSFGDNLNLLYSVAPGSMTDTVGFWRDDVFAFLRVVEQFARTVGQHISEDAPNPNDRTLWAGPGARAALADAQAKTKAFCDALMDFANAVGGQAEDVMQRAATAKAAFEPLMGQGVDSKTGRRSLTAEQSNEMNEQMQKILQALYNAAGQPVCAPVDPIAQSARLSPYTGEAPSPGGATSAIHKPQGLPSPASGAQPPSALQALADQAKREAPRAHEAQHEGEAPAGDPSQAAKGAGDALGQAGQAAGQAAQGAGQGAGKGGGDPSQLASGLADALKPKDGSGLGAGAAAGLPVDDEGLPGSVDAAAFAAPVGGLGGAGGVGGSAEPRYLSQAPSHGGPAQQAQPVSQLSSLAQQGQRGGASAGGGMGSMPMGGAPTHGQQGGGAGARKTPDYLKKAALLSADPAAFGVVPVVGQLTDEEVALRDQRAEESEAEERAEGARRA